MIRLGTFYSVIMIHNGPVFSPKCDFFFPPTPYIIFGQQKYTSRPSVLFHLQQRDVQNAISDKKYNKMMEGGEKHWYKDAPRHPHS